MTQRPLHDAVVERWGSEIASGARRTGERVLTDDAVAEFGASRSAIREAVRVLESLGMIEVRQRVGITVRPPEAWSPYDERVLRWRLDGPERASVLQSLSELRAGVEPVAARLAASRATPEQCGELVAAAIGMAATARAANSEAYLAHDSRFHSALLEASGNRMFANLATAVIAVLEGRTHHELMPATADPAAVRLHGEVAAAVQRGDGDAAEAGMRTIVAESLEAMIAQRAE